MKNRRSWSPSLLKNVSTDIKNYNNNTADVKSPDTEHVPSSSSNLPNNINSMFSDIATKPVFTIPQADRRTTPKTPCPSPVSSENNSFTHIDNNIASHLDLKFLESDYQQKETYTSNGKHKSRNIKQNKLSHKRNNPHSLILKLKEYLYQQLITLHAKGKIDYKKCNDILSLLEKRNLEIETLQFLILQYETEPKSYNPSICHRCGHSQKFFKQKISPIQKNYAYRENLKNVINSFSKLEIN